MRFVVCWILFSVTAFSVDARFWRRVQADPILGGGQAWAETFRQRALRNVAIRPSSHGGPSRVRKKPPVVTPAHRGDHIETPVSDTPTTVPAVSAAAARRKQTFAVLHHNQMFRETLTAALSSVFTPPEFTVLDYHTATTQLGGSTPFERFENFIRQHQPTLAIVDLRQREPTAAEITTALHGDSTAAKTLLLGNLDNEDDRARYTACLAHGAEGPVSNDASFHDLHQAIHVVLRGEHLVPHDMVRWMATRLNGGAGPVSLEKRDGYRLLSVREREILELIGQHYGNKQIAKALHISLHTAKNHVHNILEKLGVQTRHQAVDLVQRRF